MVTGSNRIRARDCTRPRDVTMSSSVLFEQSDHVARITLNRPHVLNAMDTEAHEVLSGYLDQCESDDSIRLVVLTGAGDRAFSVGRDLKAMAAENELDGDAKRQLEARWARIRRLTDRHEFTKPLIARVNGIALGGGFELALACDVIIAAQTAHFALPEPLRGLIPFAGGAHRLPRQLPLKVAMGYLLTGRPLHSSRAFELGLVNSVVPAASLDVEVDHWIRDMLACAPLALRAIKQSVMQGLGRDLREAMSTEYSWETKRRDSLDSREGPRAFAEKRQPVWTGR
jgi:enoyl-CoA hydratase/carnithine racemase